AVIRCKRITALRLGCTSITFLGLHEGRPTRTPAVRLFSWQRSTTSTPRRTLLMESAVSLACGHTGQPGSINPGPRGAEKRERVLRITGASGCALSLTFPLARCR